MIVLFTDFGAQGPYLGQLEAVLHRFAPEEKVINLLSDAPMGKPRLSAYLLAALCKSFPEKSVFLCIVDPGVGGDRQPVALEADGRWFVGPDNGLLNAIALQAQKASWTIIDWRPEKISASFHGRDLFAPIAARIALHDFDWPHRHYEGPDLSNESADIAEIVYFDFYGNAITGLRYGEGLSGKLLCIGDQKIPEADTFCQVGEGCAFWYKNSMDLVEIAVNQGPAKDRLGLELGMAFYFEDALKATRE